MKGCLPNVIDKSVWFMPQHLTALAFTNEYESLLPAQQLRYCPSCTFANPRHATECERCQTPFSAGTLPAKSGSWPLYLAIAIAVLLAIALIVVLILK